MNPFEVVQPAARSWLTEAIIMHEFSNDPCTSGGAKADIANAAAPAIGMNWQASAIGQEDICVQLIHKAQEAGVLSGPAEMTLEFEIIDDGDDGAFRFLLAIARPVQLTLASQPQELATLGARPPGIEAALTFLHRAAAEANLLHRRLQQYVIATARGSDQ